MASRGKRLISAQVILRPASGKTIDGRTQITSENVSDYAPSSEDMVSVPRAFEEAGFTVGNLVGNGFSITAPAATFEKLFKVKLQSGEKGSVTAAQGKKGGESYELPVHALPKETAHRIAAVTFTPPPDFGPTGY